MINREEGREKTDNKCTDLSCVIKTELEPSRREVVKEKGTLSQSDQRTV